MTPTIDSRTVWARVPPLWRARLERLGEEARRRGERAALVGGCLRDLILDVPPKDWDVVVEGNASPLVRQLADGESAGVRSHPAFLTFTMTYPDGASLDVATARKETYVRPAALPSVRSAPLEEDAARRDFSINALYLFLPPGRGELWDPAGGLSDLENGRVRALHDKSFVDDPTRIYRAARYAGRYGWRVEETTLEWIRRAAKENRPAALSPVRRRNELFLLLGEGNPVPALKLLWEWGLWKNWDQGWSLTNELADQLKAAPPGDLLAVRLALLLTSRPGVPAAAEAWLKSVSTPVGLRRNVLGHIPGPSRVASK